MQRLRLIAGCWIILATSTFAAEEPAGAIVGEVVLPSKIAARYEYHFNQNALRDFRISGENIVALTDSGSLLRFDSKARKLKQTRFDPEPIVCLGTDRDNGLLCGFEKGRICRVDPATLGLTEVVKLEGKPRWLEMRPGGLLDVVERMGDVKIKGQIYRRIQSFVHDASSGKTISAGYPAAAFLLDRQGRLWKGDDRGEWGGSLSRVDLKAGTIDVIAPPKQRVAPEQHIQNYWDGVYGLIELRDGQIWAYGGTMHGFGNCAVTRVESDMGVLLAGFESPRLMKKKPPRPSHPIYPITQIIEETDGRLLVFSYDSIYRADAKLVEWERVVDLKLNYRLERPDTVGVYPAINTVQRLPGPGLDLLCATTLNGFLRFADGKLSYETLPGRLGASQIDQIRPSAEGLLFWGEETETDPWRFAAGVWEQMSFVPPFVMHPDELKEQKREEEEFNEEERQKKALVSALLGEEPKVEIFDERPPRWDTTKVLIGHDGKITTVSASFRSPGTTTTVRWRNDKPEVLGSEMSSIDPATCFITADGVLWNVTADVVREFNNGRWIISTKGPVPGPPTDPTAICRDGLGRNWRIADGLSMSVPGEKVAHSFKDLPMIGRTSVTAIAADPDHPDGIAAALEDGGVVFVMVPKGP